MRALAALRMVWASAVWMAVEMLATWCGPCAFVRPRVPCVPCVSRLPPVSFYR